MAARRIQAEGEDLRRGRAWRGVEEGDPVRMELRGGVGDEIEAGHGVGHRALRSLQADDGGRAR